MPLYVDDYSWVMKLYINVLNDFFCGIQNYLQPSDLKLYTDFSLAELNKISEAWMGDH